MTEPSTSPVPTTSSNPSWLDWIGPLDDLWANHPFIAATLGALIAALITAVVSGIGWALIQVWRKWQQWRHQQRIVRRRQQLPPVLLPFTVEIGNQRLTIEPAQPQHNFAPEGMSIVRLLGAKSTPTPFLDRAGALARLETWARSEERFAIHILGGDGGSGKTRLGVELCRRLTTPNAHHRGTEVWQAGFLQNIEQSDSTSTSDDASSLLLVVDYAEARPETVTEVINIALRAAEDPARQRVRIAFLVRRPSPLSVTHRSSNEWLDALRPQESKDEGLNRVLDEASTIILNDEELSDTERRDLFTHAHRAFTCSPESTPSPELTGRLSDPVYSQPLLVTVDAFLNAHPLSNPRISCSPSELFEEVLCHEERYWDKHWPSSLATDTDRDHQAEGAATPTHTSGDLNRKLARQAVATATLTNIQNEEDAISLLQLLPVTPRKNTRDLAKWLRACYPPHMNSNGHSTLWCEHLEPDRIGEHLVVSEIDDLEPILRELLSPHRVGTSSIRTWIVLERVSTNPHLNEHVGRILNDVLVEVTQAVHTQTINSQSPDLAAAFAKLFSSVCSQIDPNEAHEAERVLSESGYFTALLECELAQCAASIGHPAADAPETDRAAYASRQLSFSIHLAKIGRHIEALGAAHEATNLYRTLAEHNPAAYTPDLATSLNNLANGQAENGQLRKALQTAQEAVNIRRTLAIHNPAAYTPSLASSLSNLAVYLADNDQLHEALQTAHETTSLYRTLAKHNPAAYNPSLATSLNNLANLLDSNGQQRDALQTAHEATNLFQELASEHFRAFSSRLVTTLEMYASILERSRKAEEAARIRQERDEVLKRMKEMEEGNA